MSILTARRALFCCCTLFLFQACQPDSLAEVPEPAPEVLLNGYAGVDQRLWSFFDTFTAEAAARGVVADLHAFALIADIDDIPEENVAGRCSYGYYTDRKIIIDEDFFNRSNTAFREMIIFHELGHCFLNRGHREDQFENGICKSIMRSGTGTCLDYYRTDTREYFLDELFEKTE